MSESNGPKATKLELDVGTGKASGLIKTTTTTNLVDNNNNNNNDNNHNKDEDSHNNNSLNRTLNEPMKSNIETSEPTSSSKNEPTEQPTEKTLPPVQKIQENNLDKSIACNGAPQAIGAALPSCKTLSIDYTLTTWHTESDSIKEPNFTETDHEIKVVPSNNDLTEQFGKQSTMVPATSQAPPTNTTNTTTTTETGATNTATAINTSTTKPEDTPSVLVGPKDQTDIRSEFDAHCPTCIVSSHLTREQPKIPTEVTEMPSGGSGNVSAIEVKRNQDFEKSVTNLLMKSHNSSLNYYAELDKIRNKSSDKPRSDAPHHASDLDKSGKTGHKQRAPPQSSGSVLSANKTGNYQLIEVRDPEIADYVPPPWIPLATPEQIHQNLHRYQQCNESAVLINDEDILQSNDFFYNKHHKMFTNKRNTFYLGHYRQHHALIKKVNANCQRQEKEEDCLDPLWISIAKFFGKQLRDFVILQRSANPSSADLSTPPFIQIYEIFYLSSSRNYFVFMELAPNKTLHYRIKHRNPIYLVEAKRWSSQLLNGIIFLQNNCITHRTLRLEHLVLDKDNNIKIIGWRRALLFLNPVDMRPNLVSRREHRVRQNNHLPPEAFQDNYDPKTLDIWSFGVILCSISLFRYPFCVGDRKETFEQDWKVFRDKQRTLLNTELITLLDRIFVEDPEKRMTPVQIQQCKFFEKMPDNVGTAETKLNAPPQP